MKLLEGLVALVTGAGRGQGRSHALTLAAHGADIVAVDICEDIGPVPYQLSSAEDLAETVAGVESIDRRAVGIRADVRTQIGIDHAVAKALEKFGQIDICVANAGIMSLAPFWELTEQQWAEVVDVNMSGVWRTAKAVAPHMIERRSGSIVITGSLNSFEATPHMVPYTAAKHGALGIMRSVALELAPYGVRCNMVCPGATDTAMINWQGMYDRFAGQLGGTRQDLESGTRKYHALAPTGVLPPQAIADAVLWLASALASRVTGIAVPVDAGHLLLPGVNNAGDA